MPSQRQRWSINYLLFVVMVLIMILILTPFSMLPILPVTPQLDIKCHQTESLSGPYQLEVLDRKYDDARVVLLSDVHWHDVTERSDEPCHQSIVPYLANMFRNYRGKENIDFFLEIDFEERARGLEQFQQFKDLRLQLLQGENPHKFNYLQSLRIYFNECFQQMKSKCEFNGHPIRFHYSDVRSGVLHSKTDTEAKTVIQEYHKSWDVLYRGKVPTVQHIDALEKLVKKYEEHDVDFFFHISKIDKQLNKVPEQISKALRAMMITHMEKESKQLDSLYERFAYLRIERNPDALVTGFNNALSLLQSTLFLPLFDIYTLARIARHDMKQVIIYAGGFHIKNIREFLQTQMNYRLTTKADKCGVQCVDMQRVSQPLFPNE